MGAYEVEGGFSEWIKEGGNVQALGAADHLQMEQPEVTTRGRVVLLSRQNAASLLPRRL